MSGISKVGHRTLYCPETVGQIEYKISSIKLLFLLNCFVSKSMNNHKNHSSKLFLLQIISWRLSQIHPMIFSLCPIGFDSWTPSKICCPLFVRVRFLPLYHKDSFTTLETYFVLWNHTSYKLAIKFLISSQIQTVIDQEVT